MEQARLFVYGTLRRGYQNIYAALLRANSRFLGNARMRGHLCQFKSYSGAVLSDQPDEWVPGELFHLQDPNILQTLDKYEDSEFERILVKVSLDDGEDLETCLETWVYLFRGRT